MVGGAGLANTQRWSRVLDDSLPRLGLTAAMFAVGVVAGVAIASLTSAGRESAVPEEHGTATDCGGGIETLHIAADEAVVTIVEQLAERYTSELLAAGRQCIPIEVRPVTASAVVGRLTNGWRSSTHGPRPDVWIPKSTMWVELARAQLDNASVIPEDPTVLARSPTVMAMPRPMAEQLGWPEQRLTWEDLLQLADSDSGWAAADKPDWGAFRLDLTDPRYTTTGLQALLALDMAGARENTETATLLSLFRVQRALADIDASSTETLERYATADRPLEALSATPLEERELWRFNQAGTSSPWQSEQASDTPSDRPDLVAVYPEGGGDIAMESDYPYVLLNAPWVGRDVMEFAEEFGEYLLSDAGSAMFTDAGFRSRDNMPGEVLRADDSLRAMRDVSAQPPGALPEVGEFRKLRSSWVIVPRVSRTLFVVDVSGSMVQPVPGTGKTRLDATVAAARQSLQIIPRGSDVGLWEFSTGLAGGQGGGDYRELVPIGPLTEINDGRSRYDDLLDALDTLDAENDTALNDSLLAAYTALRADYIPGWRHVIVLLTDGRNDDADSISHDRLIMGLRRLHRSQEPIQVISIAYGDQPDIDKLSEISDTVGGRVITTPKLKNLENLFIAALGR